MANLATLTAEVLRLLNEATNSSVGEVGDGSGTVTTTTSATIEAYLNEAIKETCRTCIYVPAKGTITQPNPIINLSSLSLDSTYVPTDASTVNDASSMWFPLTVQSGNTNLTHCSEPSLRAYDPSFEATAVGTPKYWYRSGDYGIRVYPAPSASTTFTVYGCGVLGDISATSITVIPDDLQLKMWASYAAYKLALKNTDDPSVAQRAFWGNWYNEVRMRLWSQLDTFLRMPGSPFAIPPVTGGSDGS
jgi:hypothetical protein